MSTVKNVTIGFWVILVFFPFRLVSGGFSLKFGFDPVDYRKGYINTGLATLNPLRTIFRPKKVIFSNFNFWSFWVILPRPPPTPICRCWDFSFIFIRFYRVYLIRKRCLYIVYQSESKQSRLKQSKNFKIIKKFQFSTLNHPYISGYSHPTVNSSTDSESARQSDSESVLESTIPSIFHGNPFCQPWVGKWVDPKIFLFSSFCLFNVYTV